MNVYEAELAAVEAPARYQAAINSLIAAVRAEVALSRQLAKEKADNVRLRALVKSQAGRLDEIRSVAERYHGFAHDTLRHDVLEIIDREAS